MSFMFSCSPCSQVLCGSMVEAQVEAPYYGSVSQLKNPSLGELVFSGAASKHANLCLQGDIIMPDQEVSLPLLKREKNISIFQGCLLYKHP